MDYGARDLGSGPRAHRSRYRVGLVHPEHEEETCNEVNVLGLTFGIDPKDLAIKLPGLGRLGPGGP